MQKWEVSLLTFFALLVAAIGASQTLSATVIVLLDTIFFQFLSICIAIGLLYLSPIVGIAASVVVALLFVMRNNSHVKNRIDGGGAPLPSISSSIARETGNGGEEITQHPVYDNIATEEEIPEGQFPLSEDRPVSSPTLRELEYAPLGDTGSNTFTMIGDSIDEKGIMAPSIKPWA